MKVGLSRLAKIVVFFAIALSLGTVSIETASANTRICSQLEAELASATAGGRSPAQVRKYDIAVDKQRDEIQRARARARDQRCSPSLFGDGSPKCGALNTKIERMERNLEALQRKRARLASGKAGRSRAQILAALDANGCRDDAVAERRLPSDVDNNRNVLEQILGGGIRQRQSLEEFREERDDPHVRRLPDPLDRNAGRSTKDSLNFLPLPASSGRCASEHVTVIFSRCRRRHRWVISVVTRRTANRAVLELKYKSTIPGAG